FRFYDDLLVWTYDITRELEMLRGSTRVDLQHNKEKRGELSLTEASKEKG
ncbi:hypothetical protein PRIPAC_74558, partial [Pristionchus pacificus]|uniref:Uncharacterized protein n=1 Tax=Pristionchus pacificus TaxID=54126 RepID=A0A2A6BFC1_PRIPA